MTWPRPAAAPSAGQGITRVDGPLKVTGGARYAADHPVPDHVHAVLVCTTTSRGRLDGVDGRAALGQPDVLSVIADFRGVTLPWDTGRVWFYGQPVAVVVARSAEAAAHAAGLVTVRVHDEPAVVDIDDPAAARRPAKSHPEYRRGDPDAVLRGAPVVVDRRYGIARNYHNPMEIPATIASWSGDRLTVWDKVQAIHRARSAYADAFGLAAENVRVISPFVGGAFGSAGRTWPHQLLAAFAARAVRRPVKLVLTRPQMYSAIGFRPASRQRMALGAGRDGRILATVHESEVEVSRYGSYEDSPTENTAFVYSSPALRTAARAVPLDVSEPTFMRGPGAVTGAFALECALDELAERLGIDPIELRLRNEPERDQSTGNPFSTRRLVECLRRGADAFGWARRDPRPGSTRSGNLLLGTGVAGAIYGVNRTASSAFARITADGGAELYTAASDTGPGTYTSMTQVAADALGLPLSRTRIFLGDSRFPEAAPQWGSQVMLSVGSSVALTAGALRDRAVRTAVLDPGSPLHGLAPGDVVVVDGRMQSRSDGARGEGYRDLLARRGLPSLDSRETYEPDGADSSHSMHSFGAVFAEVAVDEALGTIAVRRLHAVYDAGRIVNPRLARSQALGGMIQGIGMALLERGELDRRDGRLVNANLSDYLAPVNADVPDLGVEFIDGRDDVAGPIGVKGLGEIVMVGVPAALANAVHHATGRRFTNLPITLDELT